MGYPADIHCCEELYKQASHENSRLGYAVYRECRNSLVEIIRNAQESHQFSRLNAIIDPAKMWKALAHLSLIKTSLFLPLNFFSPDQLNSYCASISAARPPCRSELLDLISDMQCMSPSSTFRFIQTQEISHTLASMPIHSYVAEVDISRF